ncbi:MAG: hemerythrin family protein, partial [Rhodospirillaceae bacterium]|nr:hemerythrin family protein [Rhodospirillaceae bacterium]
MSFVEWSSKYDTGVELIDADHQTLFATINMIHDRAEEGLDADIIGRAITVLTMYVDRHFAREEALMDVHGYPDLVSHIAIHRRISEKVHGFQTAFAENPDTISTEPFLKFLREWLTEHILKCDMDYLPYVSSKPD